MRYIEYDQTGEAKGLSVQETETPTCGKDQLLIKVAAAGVNRPDVMQRKGLYAPPPDASPILGLEVAGEIAEIGSDITGYELGDKVCALVNGGGYAQYVAVPASQCLPIPRGLSMVEAASLPETYFTVWSNVFDRAALQPGESLLVHGGSSGIGVTAIQMARAMGSTVYTTAGSEEKCQVCRDLGATLAVNYKTDDFAAVISEHTKQQGVDVILDMVAGKYVQKNMSLAARNGRIVMIAFMGGHKANLSMLPMLVKSLTLSAATLRPQSQAEKASIAQQLHQTIWPLISAKEIVPVIAAEMPLEDASRAHQLMESSVHIGKIVLTL